MIRRRRPRFVWNPPTLRVSTVVLQNVAQGAGGLCLTAAGWLVEPSLGLGLAAAVLFVWSQPRKGDR